MKANEAIAVGVEACEVLLEGRPRPESTLGIFDLREAAKTLAALGPFVEAALALAKYREATQGAGVMPVTPEMQREAYALADAFGAAYAALGLDPAPHGGASDKA